MTIDERPSRFGSAAVDTIVVLTQANALIARALGRALDAWDVSWPQALSLLVLAEQSGPISATRLVEHLGLGRTAMTSVVDRLERRGWVRRRPSAVDRRVADLLLTDAGRAVVTQIRPELERAVTDAFAGLPPKELAAWRGGLERLMNAARAGADGG